MKKTSKTQTSQQIMQSLNVNSSLQNWEFYSPYDKKKQSLYSLNPNIFYKSQARKNQVLMSGETVSNQQTKESFYKKSSTPTYKQHIIMIPQISKSFSQHKQGSKLSLQLNEISTGFNNENRRIQEALFEIRESTVKKQRQRYLKSMSLSKKSDTSKKSSKNGKFHKSIVKVLDFENLKKNNFSQDKESKMKLSMVKNSLFSKEIKETKLKKRNLNELMKQQKAMLKKFESKMRIK